MQRPTPISSAAGRAKQPRETRALPWEGESAGKPDALQTLARICPLWRDLSRSVWSASGLPALSLVTLTRRNVKVHRLRSILPRLFLIAALGSMLSGCTTETWRLSSVPRKRDFDLRAARDFLTQERAIRMTIIGETSSSRNGRGTHSREFQRAKMRMLRAWSRAIVEALKLSPQQRIGPLSAMAICHRAIQEL